MSWLVGELVAKSELDTHPGPERVLCLPQPSSSSPGTTLSRRAAGGLPGGVSSLSRAESSLPGAESSQPGGVSSQPGGVSSLSGSSAVSLLQLCRWEHFIAAARVCGPLKALELVQSPRIV